MYAAALDGQVAAAWDKHIVQTDLHYECMHERIRYGMHALICVLFDCLT